MLAPPSSRQLTASLAGIVQTGLYMWPQTMVVSGTASISTGFERVMPLFLAQPTSFDRIACEVTAAGGAGAVVRLGVRTADANGMPSTLLLDAGTVAADGSTGIAAIVIALTLSPGIWWLEACTQVAASTLRVISGSQSLPVFGATTFAAGQGAGYFASAGGVTGALPTAFTPNSSLATAPVVALRAA